MSKLEEKVITLLQKEGIKFIREKRFSDLKGGKYRFDFEVYVDGGRSYLEVQGQQHFTYVSKFYKKRSDFLAAQERDRRKISYCLAHHLPLYIIPYWELDKIHSAAALFSDKYRARSRWKNDLDWQEHQKI